MRDVGTTPFSYIYNYFLSKVTDDMYMELTKEDTESMLQELLLSAIHKFEFPRFNINDYTLRKVKGVEEEKEVEESYFNCLLTGEEMNIIATYMIVEWMGQQLASVENTQMKYSGSDFKFTSQANHMQKILTTKKDYEREGFHLQRLYARRIQEKDGIKRSTFGDIMKTPEHKERGK